MQTPGLSPNDVYKYEAKTVMLHNDGGVVQYVNQDSRKQYHWVLYPLLAIGPTLTPIV